MCSTLISAIDLYGLIEALDLVAPQADVRHCIRHMHINFSRKWLEQSYKSAVWAAARAATKSDIDEAMQVIKDMDQEAFDWLMRKDPTNWSLHGFKYYTKSDMLLNNCCESFNHCILEAREMPILSMCEWLRRKLMKTFVSKRNKMRAHNGSLTLEVTKKLNNRRMDSFCKCKAFGDGDRYKVDCAGKTFMVDLNAWSCGCNEWDLTRLPCTHAICYILKRRLRVEDFLHQCYTKEMYLRAYSLDISVMPGKDQWEKTGQPPLLPPKLVIQLGRPKKHARRKKPGEAESNKKTRIRSGKNRCGNCGEEGHTRKSCKNPTKVIEAPSQPKKGGRPPSTKTMPPQPKKRKYVKKQVRTNATTEP